VPLTLPWRGRVVRVGDAKHRPMRAGRGDGLSATQLFQCFDVCFSNARRMDAETMIISFADRSPHPACFGRCSASPNQATLPLQGRVSANKLIEPKLIPLQAYLRDIAVRPSQQGRGLGRRRLGKQRDLAKRSLPDWFARRRRIARSSVCRAGQAALPRRFYAGHGQNSKSTPGRGPAAICTAPEAIRRKPHDQLRGRGLRRQRMRDFAAVTC
jgi:GNAT superfamily N-acetyltransferase